MAETVKTSRAAQTRATNLAAFLVRMEEKFNAMESLNHERAQSFALLLQKLENQQGQLNQLTVDMAVLRSQHASFWRACAAIFGTLSLLGGAVGWAIGTFLPFVRK